MQLWKVKVPDNRDTAEVDKDGFLSRYNGKAWQYQRGDAINKAKLFNGRIVKGMISEQGMCPECGSEAINYEAQDQQDDLIYYPYQCEVCGFKGKEWFELSFQCHTDLQGDPL